jgi:hypothetical protein
VHANAPPISTSMIIFTQRIFSEEYKLCRSSLCNFLQPLVTSSLFG